MAKIITHEQGTPEWLAWREPLCTASEAPAIMGDAPDWAPVKTWDQLRMMKAGLGAERSEFLDQAAARGHEKEAIAREWLAERVGHPLKPLCLESDDGRFGASLDGANLDTKSWCEIKAPVHGTKSKLYRALDEDKRIPAAYWWQLVHQSMLYSDLVGDSRCHFVVWADDGPPLIKGVYSGEFESDVELLLTTWESFLRGEQPGRQDKDWRFAAARWLEFKRALKTAKADHDKAKEYLRELSGGKDTDGAGIKLKYVTRKGAVDWQAFAEELYMGEDFTTEADNYRKRESSSMTISEAK